MAKPYRMPSRCAMRQRTESAGVRMTHLLRLRHNKDTRNVVNLRKVLLLIAVLAGIVGFFAFDLDRYFLSLIHI